MGQRDAQKMNSKCRMQKMKCLGHFWLFKNPTLGAFLRPEKRTCLGKRGHMFTLPYMTLHHQAKYFYTSQMIQPYFCFHFVKFPYWISPFFWSPGSLLFFLFKEPLSPLGNQEQEGQYLIAHCVTHCGLLAAVDWLYWYLGNISVIENSRNIQTRETK